MKTVKWAELKKKLGVSNQGLELASAKLMLSELMFDLRRSSKMSQKELAKAIGVSQPHIAKIENGEENLTIETIVKLLCALNICLRISPEHRQKHAPVLRIPKAA